MMIQNCWAVMRVIDFAVGSSWAILMMSMVILYVADGHWHDSDLAKRILICMIGCLVFSFILFMGAMIGGAR